MVVTITAAVQLGDRSTAQLAPTEFAGLQCGRVIGTEASGGVASSSDPSRSAPTHRTRSQLGVGHQRRPPGQNHILLDPAPTFQSEEIGASRQRSER